MILTINVVNICFLSIGLCSSIVQQPGCFITTKDLYKHYQNDTSFQVYEDLFSKEIEPLMYGLNIKPGILKNKMGIVFKVLMYYPLIMVLFISIKHLVFNGLKQVRVWVKGVWSSPPALFRLIYVIATDFSTKPFFKHLNTASNNYY